MKTIFLLPLLLTSCITLRDIVSPFDNLDKVNETNYMQTPCIWDGTTVKKKPTVSNISNDSNTTKRNKER